MKVIPLAMEGVRFYVNAMDIGTEVGEDGSHRYLGQICSLNLRISQSLANTKPDLFFFLGGGTIVTVWVCMKSKHIQRSL